MGWWREHYSHTQYHDEGTTQCEIHHWVWDEATCASVCRKCGEVYVED